MALLAFDRDWPVHPSHVDARALERVRRADRGVSPGDDAVTDGGFASADDVEAVLAAGHVFELTHRTDGDAQTRLVTHVEPERPAMTPLRGPPTFWFAPVGADDRFSVRLPDIDALHPVPYEQIPAPLSPAAIAAVRASLVGDPTSVEAETLREIMAEAGGESAAGGRAERLRLAIATLDHREDLRAVAVDALVASLGEEPGNLERVGLRTLHGVAAETPGLVSDHVESLATYASADWDGQSAATRCLMELAEAEPGSVLDAVPALEVAATTAGSGPTQQCAVYALSQVAGAYPDQVYPALAALVAGMRSEDETTQTNAVAAIGKIAADYPAAGASIVDEVADLLAADASRVRTNAAGVLADVADQHAEAVMAHADRLAGLLAEGDAPGRQHASIALLGAGAADPGAIRDQGEEIRAALDDDNPAVRANACTLIGNADVPVARERLQAVRESDDDETVRERAAWALAQRE